MKLPNLKIITWPILAIMIASCSNGGDKQSARSAAPDHTKGQVLDTDANGEPLAGADSIIQNALLKLAPLESGHMMADLMISNREFRPDQGHGYWELSGFKWIGTMDSTVFKEDEVTVNFEAPDSQPTECRLNNGAWAACDSTYTATKLAEGVHEVYVRSTKSHSILGVARFESDRTAPILFKTVESSTGNIMVMGNEELSSIECKIAAKVVDCKAGTPDISIDTVISATAQDIAGNEIKIDL